DTSPLAVSSVEINAVVGLAHGDHRFSEPIDARVWHRDAIFQAASRDQLSLPDDPEKPVRRVSYRLGGQLAEFSDSLKSIASEKVLQEEFAREGVLEAYGATPLKQIVDRGARNQRGEQGHDDQSHEQALADQPELEGEQAQDDFHSAARVHPHAHGDRGAAVHPTEARTQSCAQDLAQAGYGE